MISFYNDQQQCGTRVNPLKTELLHLSTKTSGLGRSDLLEELALGGAGVAHHTHVDVAPETRALHGHLGHAPKQHEQDAPLHLVIACSDTQGRCHMHETSIKEHYNEHTLFHVLHCANAMTMSVVLDFEPNMDGPSTFS